MVLLEESLNPQRLPIPVNVHICKRLDWETWWSQQKQEFSYLLLQYELPRASEFRRWALQRSSRSNGGEWSMHSMKTAAWM